MPTAAKSPQCEDSIHLVEDVAEGQKATPKPWFVYLVRAENGALYCGISDDPQRRFVVHQSGRGARFFHSSPAVALVYVEACADKGAALRRERAIKALKKTAKEHLVLTADLIDPLDSVLSGRLPDDLPRPRRQGNRRRVEKEDHQGSGAPGVNPRAYPLFGDEVTDV